MSDQCKPLATLSPDKGAYTETDCRKLEPERKILDEVAPATARILGDREVPFLSGSTYQQGVGSGSFILDGSRVLTAAHIVFDSGGDFKVESGDGKKYTAEVETVFPACEIAVLKLTDGKRHAHTLPFARIVEEKYFALGHPHGLPETHVSSGQAKKVYVPAAESGNVLYDIAEKAARSGNADQKRDAEEARNCRFLDTTVSSHFGMSGGPLVARDIHTGAPGLVGLTSFGGFRSRTGKMASISSSYPLLDEDLVKDNIANPRYHFNYGDKSLFAKQPVETSLEIAATGGLAVAPIFGGGAMTYLSIKSLGDDWQNLRDSEDSKSALYHGLRVLSDLSFISGSAAFVALRNKTVVPAVIGLGVGAGANVLSKFVPSHRALLSITDSDGFETRPMGWTFNPADRYR